MTSASVRSSVRWGVGALATALTMAGCSDCSSKKTNPSWSPPPPPSSGPGAAFGDATPPPSNLVRTPHVAKPPRLDGELGEWEVSGRSGAFVAPDGSPVHPYSEARLFWDEQNLYIGLYAADINIQVHVTKHDDPLLALAGNPDAPAGTDDAFRVRVGPFEDPKHPFEIDINANGVFSDGKLADDGKPDFSWESHMKLAIDHDGTLNDPSDDDEEWVVEAAIPWASLGIDPKPGMLVGMDLKRCDTPKGGTVSCGAFGELPDKAGGGRLELLAPTKP